MSKLFLIGLFLIIASCQIDGIPDEIVLSEESQELGERICDCYNKPKDFKDICILDFEYEVLKRLKDLNDHEKDQFLKMIYHALIETECADKLLDEIDVNDF